MSSTMKPFEQQTYYELLEVSASASAEEIRSAHARALETYSPDSIAVYSLVEPDLLDSLHERLSKALETLCEPERRLEYDRSIGVQRSDEEVARLRAEALQSAASEGSAPKTAPPAEPVAEAAPVAEAGEQLPELPPEAVTRVPTPVPLPGAAVATVTPAPAPAAEAPPVAQAPQAPAPPSRPSGVHGRAMPAASRPGPSVPPPLPPPRNGLRSPVASRPPSAGQQLEEAPVLAQDSAIATAESALAQVSLKARDSRSRLRTVVDIPADAEFSGELLRRVRESKNLSVQQLADRTRISSRHLENIEADHYERLPASVYLRGMLMSIARELGLDPLRVSRSYQELVAAGGKKRR